MKMNLIAIFILLIPTASIAEQVQITIDELESLKRNEIYRKYELVCGICSATEHKRDLESALKRDMQYVKKYGVINYGRRDSAVQSIKSDDRIVSENKSAYRKEFKRKFNPNDCDLVNAEDCEGALFELGAKISGKTPWHPEDIYPK